MYANDWFTDDDSNTEIDDQDGAVDDWLTDDDDQDKDYVPSSGSEEEDAEAYMSDVIENQGGNWSSAVDKFLNEAVCIQTIESDVH